MGPPRAGNSIPPTINVTLPVPEWKAEPKFNDCFDAQACGACCLAAFFPCNTYANTKENNRRIRQGGVFAPLTADMIRDDMGHYSKDCEQCCGREWWIFCGVGGVAGFLAIFFWPLAIIPVPFYACTVSTEEDCEDCGCASCLQWTCCFPCKATHVYKRSVNNPESLRSVQKHGRFTVSLVSTVQTEAPPAAKMFGKMSKNASLML